MLIARDQYRLAPLYDLNTQLAYSATPAVDLSMKIGEHYRADQITGADWEALSAEVGVDYEWLRSRLLAMAESVADELSTIARSPAIAAFGSPAIPRFMSALATWTRSARDLLD